MKPSAKPHLGNTVWWRRDRKKGKIHVSLYGAFMRGTFDEDSTTWLNAISTRRRLWKNFPRLMAYRLSLNSSAVNERRGGAYTINRTKAAIAFSTRRIIPSRRRNRVYSLYNLYTRRRREHPCEKLHAVPVASEVHPCKCVCIGSTLIHTVVELQSFRKRKSDN